MTISPSTDNYVLGKGIVYFSKKNISTGIYLGERDLGNASSFTIYLNPTKTDYFSSEGGSAASDKKLYFDYNPTVNFILDEINKENLALMFMADITEVNQGSGSVVNEEVIAYPGTRLSLDYRNVNVSSIVVKNNAETVVYTKGTDYQLYNSAKDGDLGRIYVLPNGNISEGQTLKISYSYYSVTYQKIEVFEDSTIEGFLIFVADNITGPNAEVRIWRVRLLPKDEISFINDSWSTLTFTGEIVSDETNHADSPYMSIIYT